VFSVTSRKSLAVAALVAALTVGTSGAAGAETGPSPDRIIAGTVADPADWPANSAMYFKPPGEGGRAFQICGATVIAPRYVLSAAHCVESARPRRLTMVVGRYDLRDRSVGQEIAVKSVEIDPDYRPPFFRGDLAVIELRSDANVTPAALPSPAQDAEATAKAAPVRVGGWGATKPSGRKVSKVLLQATESVIAEKSCKRFYGQEFKLKDQICTRGDAQSGGGVNGACYGDSGGPLIADTLAGPLLVGVVSFGGDRCATQPEVYSRVSAGLDFIKKASGVVPLSP